MSYIKAKTYIELAPAPTSMVFVSHYTVTAKEDGTASKNSSQGPTITPCDSHLPIYTKNL